MNDTIEAADDETVDDASTEAEILQLIAEEVLPKLVDLLQDLEPRYRQRTINAALALLS